MPTQCTEPGECSLRPGLFASERSPARCPAAAPHCTRQLTVHGSPQQGLDASPLRTPGHPLPDVLQRGPPATRNCRCSLRKAVMQHRHGFGRHLAEQPPCPHRRPPSSSTAVRARHGEVVLRRHGELLQIIANGMLPDGHFRRPLRAAARRGGAGRAAPTRQASAGAQPAASPRPAPSAPFLIGGLGVGFSLAAAAAEPRWGRITVVEREQAIIDWHRDGGPLSHLSADALADPRTEILHTDSWPTCEPGRGPIATTRSVSTSTTAPTGPSPRTTTASTRPPDSPPARRV